MICCTGETGDYVVRIGSVTAVIMTGLLLAACASKGLGPPQSSNDVRKGGQYLEPWLGQALKEADRHPLGSKLNPVRADMPNGQRAYLARLRCANGTAPTYERIGNVGAGVFGSIIDQFDLRCQNSAPLRSIVFMDMYFAGHVETRPADGFKIAAP